MEAASLILNALMVVLAAYMALRDERRPRGQPATSYFRPTDDDGPASLRATRPAVRPQYRR